MHPLTPCNVPRNDDELTLDHPSQSSMLSEIPEYQQNQPWKKYKKGEKEVNESTKWYDLLVSIPFSSKGWLQGRKETEEEERSLGTKEGIQSFIPIFAWNLHLLQKCYLYSTPSWDWICSIALWQLSLRTTNAQVRCNNRDVMTPCVVPCSLSVKLHSPLTKWVAHAYAECVLCFLAQLHHG